MSGCFMPLQDMDDCLQKDICKGLRLMGLGG